MCEPDLKPGLAPGRRRCRCRAMLPGQGPPLSSLRPPRARDAPGTARRWAASILRLSGLCDSQMLVVQRCPAWIGLRWVCTAPRPRPCQPRRALPSSAPGNVQRSLLAFLEGLNSTFCSSRLSLLLPCPPSGPAPPVPASLSRRYPVKRLLLLLRWTNALAGLIWDEGWRLSARERRTLGSFPFAKWAVIARRQPPQLESIVCFLAAKGTLEQQ